jgi:hypothetical protein
MSSVERLSPLSSLVWVGAAYLSPALLLLPSSVGVWGHLGYDRQSGTVFLNQDFSDFQFFFNFLGYCTIMSDEGMHNCNSFYKFSGVLATKNHERFSM